MSDQNQTLSSLEEEVERSLASIAEAGESPSPFATGGSFSGRAVTEDAAEARRSFDAQREPAAAPVAPPSPPPGTAEEGRKITTLRSPASGVVRSLDDEVARFLSTAERMLRTIRSQIANAQSEYVIERARVADQYRRKISEMETEASDALRKLDAEHTEAIGKRQRMLDALLAMRGE